MLCLSSLSSYKYIIYYHDKNHDDDGDEKVI